MRSRWRRVLVGSAVMLLLFAVWPYRISLLDRPHSLVIESASGELLSAKIAGDGQWRFDMIEQVPERFADAITAYEDKRFWYHLGVDPFSLMRALIQNAARGKVVSGASTITMQCARLSYPGAKRSFFQKIKESLVALKLEIQFSKNDILRLYATHAPFGGNVVGLEAAAWRYFGKSADELSWAETATLAVLPNAPSLVTIEKNRNLLLTKRNRLLRLLYKKNKITTSDLDLALSEPLIEQIYELPHHASHYLEWCRTQKLEGRIASSIDYRLQQQLSSVLNDSYGRFSASGIHNASIIVIENKTQQIRSYVGNIPISTEESAVDMIQARRSSGSILKPILYASMLSEGMITPDQLIRDSPLSINGFSPNNYHRTYSGAVPAGVALSRSLNVPFVVLLQQYGIDKFIKILRNLGLSTINRSADHYGLSLILGGAEVTLYEMTRLYSKLSRVLLGLDKCPLSSAALWHTYEAMSDVQRPNDFGEWEQYSSTRRIAWKTGTSYGHRDAWAIGCTPTYTIGVWVGNADGEGRNQLVGVSTAGQVLFEALDVLPADQSWFVQPYEGMTWVSVCRSSGMLASQHCKVRDTLLLGTMSERAPICPYHTTVLVDSTASYRLDRSCDQEKSRLASYFVLPPVMAHYYKKVHSDYHGLLPLSPGCSATSQSGKIEFIYPYSGETVYLPRDFDGEGRSLITKVSYSGESKELYWYLNEEFVGVTSDFHSIMIKPPAGEHMITCVDQYGYKKSSTFSIINQ